MTIMAGACLSAVTVSRRFFVGDINGVWANMGLAFWHPVVAHQTPPTAAF
jgi:hypothetical protein